MQENLRKLQRFLLQDLMSLLKKIRGKFNQTTTENFLKFSLKYLFELRNRKFWIQAKTKSCEISEIFAIFFVKNIKFHKRKISEMKEK
jgi:hypothetical protein